MRANDGRDAIASVRAVALMKISPSTKRRNAGQKQAASGANVLSCGAVLCTVQIILALRLL
jgi:hypothetical protein